MLQAFFNIFRVPDLRKRVLFTLGVLIVYRIGFWVPLVGVDQQALIDAAESASTNASGFGQLIAYAAIFSGGSFSQSTIFGLGIMPYISASIIFQLLTSVWPALKKMQEEGPTGRQRIQDLTRRVTIVLCLIQGWMWLGLVRSQGGVYAQWADNPVWWIMALTALTAGSIFLMWLGEQIDKHCIGNGVSMIIMAGILTGIPNALLIIVNNSPVRTLMPVVWVLGPPADGYQASIPWMGLIFLAACFVGVVAGAVLLTVAQRRIPVQQAKHTRGRRVFGGQRSYLPLKVNHGGVMPIIFASTLMLFPAMIVGGLAEALTAGSTQVGWWGEVLIFLGDQFQGNTFPYVLIYIMLVFFFSYFWITVQFNPEDMSKQLKEHGSFIPGLRPGPRTAEYLTSVMERITYVGAGALALLAVLPNVVSSSMGIDFAVTQFIGGTGLLIVVSVSLDFLQRVEAALLMRNYEGFLGGDAEAPRIRGPRG